MGDKAVSGTAVPTTVGLLGAGRMGAALAHRLLDAGTPVVVWNRTTARAQPLVDAGATRADTLADLGRHAVVLVSVSASDDLIAVLEGPGGLLAGADGLRTVVDCSTVSVEASARARNLCADAGIGFVAAPVSGNPGVLAAGNACIVASCPAVDFARAEPHLATVAKTAVLVGEAEESRLVKLCHNLYLGIMVQALVEVTTLAEKGGADREGFLRFLGDTVVGSEWIRQRTGSLVARDWTPTFTTRLLRKDLDLGLGAAREHEVPMLLAGAVSQLVQAAIGQGLGDSDLLATYDIQARAAGLT